MGPISTSQCLPYIKSCCDFLPLPLYIYLPFILKMSWNFIFSFNCSAPYLWSSHFNYVVFKDTVEFQHYSSFFFKVPDYPFVFVCVRAPPPPPPPVCLCVKELFNCVSTLPSETWSLSLDMKLIGSTKLASKQTPAGLLPRPPQR